MLAAPDVLTAAAAEVETIGSTIRMANAAAAGPTSDVLAAAGDEVSAAITNVFNTYGQAYQAVTKQVAAFHEHFTDALAAAANQYAEAEAANAIALFGGSRGIDALTPAASSASADPLTALIMGGTGNPTPDPAYVKKINKLYIQRLFPGATPQGLFTPEQMWPFGSLTAGQSVAQGVKLLNSAINTQLATGHNVVVFGYSQSATIATDEINALMALPPGSRPDPTQLSFILAGDPNNPDGGLAERFPGFYLPFLDIPFNGATPQSPWRTVIYTHQYDGIADAPQYPLNPVSDLNALMGVVFAHNYDLPATQVAGAQLLPTSPDYTGNTQYYMILNPNLPLLEPIRAIPYAGPPIADVFQPDLRVLVDLGYGDYGPGLNYANVPTPASLLEIPNPFTVIPDLALGAVQGPYGAVVQIGVESGLSSPSYFPNTYPWTPSIAPHLNFFLGQRSTTVLSLLSGAAGDVLHLIPPVANVLFPI